MPDYKLSTGTAAEPLSGTELLEVTQDVGGTLQTRVATAAEIADLASGVPAGAPVAAVAASLTLGAGQAGRFLACDHATTPIVITAPQDSDWAAAVGTEVHVCWSGVAAVSVAAGTGATVSKAAAFSLGLRQRYAVATLKKVAANTWLLFGLLGDA
ncbi:hypothetical protein [Marilutibacter spongiae]|uniref:Uncharacterized protein n=1 Tax=Marilutibacter spongiae TaxID=2025720 RepID=A0A7W3Y772_9GAMM|nr:hypothetical protein [Lysobacter spongiae]MBB1061874.1 hypothetical protein [Lysobacter spongiae]